MPSVRFNRSAQVLTIIPLATEKLLAVNGKSRIKINYSHIKAVTVHPKDAYAWMNSLKPGKTMTHVSNTVPGRNKPDLHLYTKPKNVVG
ncbi:UNVERIFIED_CONTAM: hypothetical protein HDU68_006873 [Siphonaria sp. JEL0065]|nr:hypothetical protein HDU68_006873 [Siphonaria sp. JEL0065]